MKFGKEEIKLSLFTDDMIFYVENPKEFTPKNPPQKAHPVRANKFSQVAGCKINTQKSVVFLYNPTRKLIK